MLMSDVMLMLGNGTFEEHCNIIGIKGPSDFMLSAPDRLGSRLLRYDYTVIVISKLTPLDDEPI